MIDTGTIILVDLERTRKTIKPAIMQNIAVRVPDWNIAQVVNTPTMVKNNLRFLTLFVIANMKNDTDAQAM